MATPLEFYRRRTLRSNLDRVIDQINRPRPLTLQLGRFQLSIPRLGRRTSTERRPDTPNVAELNIDDLDFVRLNSNETYTLNGRTIRLLGANFENYPVLNDSLSTGVRPPPYTEAMRYKLYGPPPEYLSRDALNTETTNEVTVTEQQARNNVEMPPGYDELASGGDNANNNVNNGNNDNNVYNDNNDNAVATDRDNITEINEATSSQASAACHTNNVANNDNVEHISAVIDNLPAIDSDVNANEPATRYNEIMVNNNVEINVNNN